MVTVSASASDVINTHDAQVVGFVAAISDLFGVPDYLSAVRAQPASASDVIQMHDATIQQLGVLVAEYLNLGETWSTNQIGHVTLTDSIFAHDAIIRGLPLTLTDNIGMSMTTFVQAVVAIIENLGLSDIISPLFKYKLTVAEQLNFADAILRFVGAAITDVIQINDVASGLGHMFSTVIDNIGLREDISSSRMIFAAMIQDGIDVTDAELVKMIFHSNIADGITVSGGYFEPSGSITTWAMNTRTHAVTEYTNYNFNSFAKMGDMYLGATKNGLYNLSGDNDAGTNIIADIKSGFAQFAGVHMSSFKGAYIAARGGGSYVLKILTGTGQEYDYAVTTDSMKTARIDLGKGIRARYFAFELISSGQDFDLDSLEFIPLIAKRRV